MGLETTFNVFIRVYVRYDIVYGDHISHLGGTVPFSNYVCPAFLKVNDLYDPMTKIIGHYRQSGHGGCCFIIIYVVLP